MKLWAFAVLSGCGFEVHSSVDAAMPPVDMKLVDMEVRTSCDVGAGTPETTKGPVGLSTGGTANPELRCDANEVITAVAYDMSNGNANGQNSPSARGIRIYCGTVRVDATGTHVTPGAMKQIDGSGGSGWAPSTWTSPTACPNGGVVAGLYAHSGVTLNVTNLFLDTAIMCVNHTASGGISSTSIRGIVDPTMLMGQNPSSAQCGPSGIVAGVTAMTGAGLDSLMVQCAPAICR